MKQLKKTPKTPSKIMKAPKKAPKKARKKAPTAFEKVLDDWNVPYKTALKKHGPAAVGVAGLGIAAITGLYKLKKKYPDLFKSAVKQTVEEIDRSRLTMPPVSKPEESKKLETPKPKSKSWWWPF